MSDAQSMSKLHIALFRGTSLVSRVIKWQTRSMYSHAAFYWPDTQTVVEAWHIGGVRQGCIHAAHTPGTIVDYYSVDLPEERSEEEVYLWLMGQVGKAYDYRGVLKFISRRKAAIKEGKWFCSELVMSGCAHANVHLLLRIANAEVSPGQVALSPLLKAAGQVVTK